MVEDNFSPPPGVPVNEVIISPPLNQIPKPGISTDKISIADSSSPIVQNAEATLIDSTANSVSVDDKMAERKQHLEELKFKLEERKVVHDMKVEMRKIDFAEREQLKQDKLVGAGNDHWLKTYWRPAMAWLYAIICTCDFVVFPVLWNMIQIYNKQPNVTAWAPLTLQGSGFVHVAFGAILGVSAWSRGRETTTAMTNTYSSFPIGTSSMSSISPMSSIGGNYGSNYSSSNNSYGNSYSGLPR